MYFIRYQCEESECAIQTKPPDHAKRKSNHPDASHQILTLAQHKQTNLSLHPSSKRTQFNQTQPSKTQTPLHLIPNLSLILRSAVTPHLSSLNISRALIIRLSKHAHNRDEDLLHALDRRPALRGMFVVVRVIAGGMEDGDADSSVGIDYECNG